MTLEHGRQEFDPIRGPVVYVSREAIEDYLRTGELISRVLFGPPPTWDERLAAAIAGRRVSVRWARFRLEADERIRLAIDVLRHGHECD